MPAIPMPVVTSTAALGLSRCAGQRNASKQQDQAKESSNNDSFCSVEIHTAPLINKPGAGGTPAVTFNRIIRRGERWPDAAKLFSSSGLSREDNVQLGLSTLDVDSRVSGVD
jgi:hypothetical protein